MGLPDTHPEGGRSQHDLLWRLILAHDRVARVVDIDDVHAADLAFADGHLYIARLKAIVGSHVAKGKAPLLVPASSQRPGNLTTLTVSLATFYLVTKPGP